MFETYLSVRDLAAHLHDESWVVVDCRYALGEPDAGRQAYEQGHIPGAVYADLKQDLSGAHVPGETGRHPLPDPETLVDTLENLGIRNSSQVVAYDGGSGQLAAGRLWWLLKWAGHDAAAVLDGGLPAWQAEGLPLQTGRGMPRSGNFRPHFRTQLVATTREVAGAAGTGQLVLADSRSADRYRGENETIDPVAGHIPGAVCIPFAGNIGSSGTVLPVEDLRERFRPLLRDGSQVAFYCGSGVTATQNVLSFAHAGLGMPKLYAGSWSEWITDPSRPVETR